MISVRLAAVPLTLREANAYVTVVHRHHGPVRGMRWAIGAIHEGQLVGVALCGRPVARGCDQRFTLEVLRLCTDGTRNVCSFLYGAAARAAQAMGYTKAQTYILKSENGASLKAAGYVLEAEVDGRPWEHTTGPRANTHPLDDKTRWARALGVTPTFDWRTPELEDAQELL